MPAHSDKDAKSLSDIQKRIQKYVNEDEKFAATMESISQQAQEHLRQIAQQKTPGLKDLGRELAARLVEERLQQQRQDAVDAELLDAGIRWIESKWGEQPCPYCQHVEWQVGTPLEISASEGEVMSPAFPVMCGSCGHTTFVNAIRAGLLSELDEDKE